LLLLFGSPVGEAAADKLLLPAAVERNQSIEIVYSLEHPATGQGFLDVEWSDVDGRLIERRRTPVDLTKASQVAFLLDTGRALTMKNQLTARFSLDSMERGDVKSRLENSTSKSFIISPSGHPWTDYQIIMWQYQTQAAYAALKQPGSRRGWSMPAVRGTPRRK